MKKVLPAIFLFILFTQQNAFAKENFIYSNSKLQDQCTLLGPNPSFIVKLKNHSPILSSASMKQEALQPLSGLGMTFAKFEPTPDGDYIFSFKPPILPASASIQNKAGCYTREAIEKLVNHIKQITQAEYVIPNRLSAPYQLALPEINTLQWNLLSPPGGIDIQGAWSFTRGHPETVVAIFDTGQLKHDALDANTLQGVSFTSETFYPGHQPAPYKVNGYNHGTHVAGTVASSGNIAYNKRIYGVAPASKLLPVNIFTTINSIWTCLLAGSEPPCLLSYQQDQINALNWLIGYKKEKFDRLPTPPESVVGINMSFGGEGGECDPKMQKAIDRVLAKNITIAVAAGNNNVDSGQVSPANCRGVISVAAVGYDGLRGSHYSAGEYSNYGKTVKIAAPGGSNKGSVTGEIYSTGDANYFYSLGTSMASPHVAGLIALLASADPTLSPEMILDIIQSTATPFPVSGNSNTNCQGTKSCGAGIINAAAAVKKARAQAASISWNRNLHLAVLSSTEALISWETGQWVPERKLPLHYTVNLNGQNVPECSHISSTVCKLTNLKPGSRYTVLVKATDPKKLYGYEKSVVAEFSTFPTIAKIILINAYYKVLCQKISF